MRSPSTSSILSPPPLQPLPAKQLPHPLPPTPQPQPPLHPQMSASKVHADFVLNWLRETFFLGSTGSLSKDTVFQEYLVMCASLQFKPVSSSVLGKLVHKGTFGFLQMSCLPLSFSCIPTSLRVTYSILRNVILLICYFFSVPWSAQPTSGISRRSKAALLFAKLSRHQFERGQTAQAERTHAEKRKIFEQQQISTIWTDKTDEATETISQRFLQLFTFVTTTNPLAIVTNPDAFTSIQRPVSWSITGVPESLPDSEQLITSTT